MPLKLVSGNGVNSARGEKWIQIPPLPLAICHLCDLPQATCLIWPLPLHAQNEIDHNSSQVEGKREEGKVGRRERDVLAPVVQ